MIITTSQTGDGPRFTISRRTFDACEHPKGSEERARLNLRAETSEYMPSYRYTLRTPQGCTSYRTKREADAALERIEQRENDEADAATNAALSNGGGRFTVTVPEGAKR